MISDALSVLAVLLAACGVIFAMGAHRRSRRVMIQTGTLPDGTVPRRSDLKVLDPGALRDMAIIRYDALREMSGQLSFSLALLNAEGDGIVLTSINGRAETRTYAKAIVDGKGTQDLSPEEEEALRIARRGRGPAVPSTPAPKPKITSETGSRGTASFSQPV